MRKMIDMREQVSTARAGVISRPQALLVVGLGLGLGACADVLEVTNPNNVGQEDVERPSASAAVVNGALAQTARGLSYVSLISSTVSDELVWRGSFTYVGQLDDGVLRVTDNEWVTEAFEDLSVARWLSDEAIRLLTGFQEEGTLPTTILLGRAYLYSGINYATVADNWENFVFSDRQEAAPPVGAENMHTVYDQAIERLDEALAIAGNAGASDLELTALAMRARAKWAKALWHKLHPKGQTPADPLIDDADANADARQFVELAPADWKFQLTFGPNSQSSEVASNVNSRQEVTFAEWYAKQDASRRRPCGPFNPSCPEDGIQVEDPIDGIKAPALRDIIYGFVEADLFAPLTVVSAREMRLILAEAALKRHQIDEFASHINAVRALDGLSPYHPAVQTDIDPLKLLKHERVVNLFLYIQRRLADHYRFGEPSPGWLETGEAMSEPGSFFVIPQSERVSNCHILGNCG